VIRKLLALGALAAALAAPLRPLAFADDVASIDSATIGELKEIATDYKRNVGEAPAPRLSTAHGGKFFRVVYAKGSYTVQESYPALNLCRGGLRPGKTTELFIKLDRWGEWIYATADSTGEITKAGRIASCIRCHETSREEKP